MNLSYKQKTIIAIYILRLGNIMDTFILYYCLTFGSGQHPYAPLAVSQQVFPVLHSDFPSGHTTLSTFTSIDGSLLNQGTEKSPFVHFPLLVSHVVSDGQQCFLSEQHTA